VRTVLRRLAAMRSYMRRLNLGQEPDESIARAAGMTGPQVEGMHRLLALAPYAERYVIPTAHAEQAAGLEELGCSLDYEGGPGMNGPFGEASGRPAPVAVESFHALRERQQGDDLDDADELRGRVNLLNWDGKGTPDGLFPKRRRK
jgi:nitrate reductase beta subunit